MSFETFWQEFCKSNPAFGQDKPIRTNARSVERIARQAYEAGKTEAYSEAIREDAANDTPTWLDRLVNGRKGR